MTRFASIDIGTSSILLLILENGKNYKTICERAEISHLGKSMGTDGLIKDENIKTSLNILDSYFSECKNFGVSKENIIITGTETLRSAKNSSRFLDVFKKNFGMGIRLLTGEEESELSYIAQIKDKDKFKRKITVIDIGGGSFEIVEGKKGNIITNQSLKLGAVSITDRFFKNDPMTEPELKKAESFIEDELANIKLKFKGSLFIGVAATVTTSCMVTYKIPHWQPDLVHGRTLKVDQIKHLVSMYSQLRIEERKKITGLEENRAEIILGGTLILYIFMKKFKIEELLVSVKGLRYGILFKEFFSTKFFN